MLNYFRQKLAPQNPLRQAYYFILAFFAALINFYPSNRLKIIAITGTKGKTSTANFVTQILMKSGKKVGMISTVNIRIHNEVFSNKSKMTTLGVFALQKYLRKMYLAGCEYAVLEVSSHAMEQKRLYGVNHDVAVFTNLQNDHLEYHGSFEKYREAKLKLFKGLFSLKRKAGTEKIIVLNQDDPNFSFFDKCLADRKISYGLHKGDIKALNLELMPSGTVFTLKIPNLSEHLYLPLPSIVNVYNVLAAIAVGICLNLDFAKIKEAILNLEAVPGRIESVHAGQDYAVIVDYAHTTESLENLCATFRPMTKGKLILLFGATGGGRDRAKRPKMGEVADKYADIIILTNDDPYFDDQYAIINDIAAGIKRNEGNNFWKILDRAEAIRLALTLAKKGDTVLIAGKGGEEVMAINGHLIPWNDRKIVEDFLKRTVKVEIDGKVLFGKNKCLAS